MHSYRLSQVNISKLHLFPSLLLFILFSTVQLFTQENLNTELLGRWAEGPTYTVQQSDDYLFINNGCYVEIYEDMDTADFKLLTKYEAEGFVYDIKVNDTLLYLAIEGFGLNIINIKDISNPQEISYTPISGYYPKIALNNDHLYYSTNSSSGLNLIDISDPINPQLLKTYGESSIKNLIIHDQYLYASCGWSGLKVFDLSDTELLTEVYVLDEDYCYSVNIFNHLAGVMLKDSLLLMDITTPEQPQFLSKTRINQAYNCVIDSNRVYASGYSLYSIDITDPTSPEVLGSENVYSYSEGISFNGNKICVATQLNGLQIFEIDESDNFSLFQQIESVGYSMGLTVQDNIVYVAQGSNGFSIVDVSNPNNPAFIKRMITSKRVNHIEIIDNYLLSSENGIKIYDISDPLNPFEVSYVETQATSYKFRINNGILYLAAGGDGLVIIDVSDLLTPTILGEYETPGTAYNLDVVENTVYVADGNGGLRIIDTEDLTSPIEVAFIDSSWMTPLYAVKVFDHYAWIGSSNFGIRIIDISTIENPVRLNYLNTARGRDIIVEGNLAFVSAGFKGFYIYDIHSPADPIKVGFYDTSGKVYEAALSDGKIFLADYQSGISIIRYDICSALLAESNPIDVSCYGACDGSIEITDIRNGVEPFQLSWNNGSTENPLLDLCAGSYVLTITDDNECSVSMTFEIEEPRQLDFDDIDVIHITDTEEYGSIAVTIYGGTEPYEFQWIGPNAFESTAQNLNNLASGCYSLIVTDANECVLLSDEICVEDQSTATGELKYSNQIKVFPNPASDYVKFEFYGSLNSLHKDGKVDARLLDISGKPIIINIPHDHKLDLHHLNNGIYILHFITDRTTYSAKIILCR